MAQPTAAFKSWLKDSTNMKLSSDASVLRLTKEGITNFESLTDFDKKSLERLPATISKAIDAIIVDVPNNINAEPAVPGANLSSISVRRLIVGDNSNLPVESRKCKLTYAEIVSASTAVQMQNKMIAAGRSPADEDRSPANQRTRDKENLVMSNSSLKRNNPVSLTST